MTNNRRDFLKLLGLSTLAAGSAPLISSCYSTSKTNPLATLPFQPLAPSKKDQLLFSKGFDYKVLISAEDKISPDRLFGHNNDYVAFLPFNDGQNQGLMWVNHEYLHPVMVHKKAFERGEKRTPAQYDTEMECVGGSIIEVKQVDGQWQVVTNSKYNRRIDGKTPIPFEKGYTINGATQAIGTFANCAGGVTPWGTVLTCEENYDIFYGDIVFDKDGKKTFKEKQNDINWHHHKPLPPEHYGWVVEVDLKTGKAVKRIALGRFKHEGAAVTLSSDGFPVVYMGDDQVDGFIYKFVSNKKDSLESGTLYVADTNKGQWISLERDKHPALQKQFASQTEVLTYCTRASQLLGATPQDRPEDIEIHPTTGEVFVALTKNPRTNNYNGAILKISESNKNYKSMSFESTKWLSGGRKAGFCCPDNLAFDQQGNMWLTVDMSEKDIRKGKHEGYGNNGLFFIPTSGPHAGVAMQVASAPVDAEISGPYFSPDYKTLFLAIQHPGSSTRDPKNPTSRWPSGHGFPKSSVVAVQGATLEKLTT